jgi:arginine exporter protein ArgO
MKKSDKFVLFFLAAIAATTLWFYLLTFHTKLRKQSTNKENVVIIKQDLPSRYGGWRVQ